MANNTLPKPPLQIIAVLAPTQAHFHLYCDGFGAKIGSLQRIKRAKYYEIPLANVRFYWVTRPEDAAGLEFTMIAKTNQFWQIPNLDKLEHFVQSRVRDYVE